MAKDKTNTDKERTVTSVDDKDNSVTVLIKKPTPQEYRDSQVAYNKTFRSALDSRALLRQKLTDYMRDQGIWDDAKQEQNDKYVDEIAMLEDKLKAGGIRLSEAKKIALALRDKRFEFRNLLSERNALDGNTAEGQADNARFNALVCLCILNADTKQPCFVDQQAYDSQAEQPWAMEAASELASMIYGLDPNYDNNLEENKFFKEFKFVDEELRFINDDGHLVDLEGRLVNEEGRFIAYRTEKGRTDETYFVNKDGEEINEDGEKVSLLKRKPFLDDSDNPIVTEAKAEETQENDTEQPKVTKKKARTSKVDTKNN